jgi:hypothetical protein
MAGSGRREPWTDEENAIGLAPDLNHYDEFVAKYEEKLGAPCVRSFHGWNQKRRLAKLPAYRVHRSRGPVPLDPLAQENEEMQKAQLEIGRLRDQVSLMRRRDKSIERAEIFAEKIIAGFREALPTLDPYDTVPQTVAVDGEEEQELMLALSDLQIGQKTDVEDTGGIAEFNWEIYENEVQELERQIIFFKTRNMQGVPIRTLNIAGLGDFVDHDSMREGHPWEVDAHVAMQACDGPRALVQMLGRLLHHFDKIKLKGIGGNHGQGGRKKQGNPYLRSWDLVFLRMLQEMCRHEPRIEIEISPTWFMVWQVNGHRFLLLHGEDVKSWMSIPYYGFERARGRWLGMLQMHLPDDVKGEAFHYMVAGHHHTPAFLSTTAGPIILNGSWPGGSKFSVKALQAQNPPSQWLWAIHPRLGVTTMAQMYLRAKDERMIIPIYG